MMLRDVAVTRSSLRVVHKKCVSDTEIPVSDVPKHMSDIGKL